MPLPQKRETNLHGKRIAACGAILSITKSVGSIPSVSPFEKGGWGDFEIDFLGRKYNLITGPGLKRALLTGVG
jgi:hypothetical protein